jgi:hypothetical protein
VVDVLLFVRRSAAVLTLLALLGQAAAAQTNTGEILGVVRDVQGGRLSGATILLDHRDSGIRTRLITDDHGRYVASALRVGSYTITVELMGFQRIMREGVVVQLG